MRCYEVQFNDRKTELYQLPILEVNNHKGYMGFRNAIGSSRLIFDNEDGAIYLDRTTAWLKAKKRTDWFRGMKNDKYNN